MNCGNVSEQNRKVNPYPHGACILEGVGQEAEIHTAEKGSRQNRITDSVRETGRQPEKPSRVLVLGAPREGSLQPMQIVFQIGKLTTKRREGALARWTKAPYLVWNAGNRCCWNIGNCRWSGYQAGICAWSYRIESVQILKQNITVHKLYILFYTILRYYVKCQKKWNIYCFLNKQTYEDIKNISKGNKYWFCSSTCCTII